jgi:hypothetical protein
MRNGRFEIGPDQIVVAKKNVKSMFKADKKLEDLDDEALLVLSVLAERELQSRNSQLAIRGLRPRLMNSNI